MTTATKEIAVGSLEPALRVQLTDGGVPIANLGDADEVRLRGTQYGIELFDDVLVPDVDSIVSRPWVAGDTDIPGRLWLEAVIVWPGGRPQSVLLVDVVDVVPGA